jgi:hypothetical protein
MAAGSNNTLAKELETFGRLLPSLLDREGHFAVILGEELVGVYAAYEDALRSGYTKAGPNIPFLVKRIVPNEPPQVLRRAVTLCPM